MLGKIAGALVGLVVAFVAVIFAASEFGGETVTLRTFDAEGAAHETPLWVHEAPDGLWLRGGNPQSGWLLRLAANPEVELERAGSTGRYTATAVPEARERVVAAMADKYGFANSVVSVMHGDGSEVTVVRLLPLE